MALIEFTCFIVFHVYYGLKYKTSVSLPYKQRALIIYDNDITLKNMCERWDTMYLASKFIN